MIYQHTRYSINVPKLARIALFALLSPMMSYSAVAADNSSTLKPYTAVYSFEMKGLSVDAIQTLKKQPNATWEYSLSASAYKVGKVKEVSVFTLDNKSIMPRWHERTYALLFKTKTLSHTFDDSSIKVADGKRLSVIAKTTPANKALDANSVLLQIRLDLLNNSFKTSYPVVDKTEIEQTIFKKLGSETIQTPAGAFNTIKIERVHSTASRKTIFWLAPSLDYIPVKVIHTDDKDGFSMLIKQITIPK